MELSLKTLNKFDNPKYFSGRCLGDDGRGNELWLFPSVDKLANRWSDKYDNVIWSDDIDGWNYSLDFALE